jgi:hypothetical protein
VTLIAAGVRTRVLRVWAAVTELGNRRYKMYLAGCSTFTLRFDACHRFATWQSVLADALQCELLPFIAAFVAHTL